MGSLNYELAYCVCISYMYVYHTHAHINICIYNVNLFIITHTFSGYMLGPFIVLYFYTMCLFLIIYPFIFSS